MEVKATMAKSKTIGQEQKAAAVVVALGTEKASKLYKYLSAEEVEALTLEVAKLGHLQAEDTENILDDFYKNCLTQKVVTDGGVEYARAVLEKAYGEDMADELLRKMSRFLKNRTFDFLSKVDTKNLFNILQNERAQTIAIVLSHMESDKAADLLAELPDKKRIQVVRNIAKMDGASPEAIKIVEAQIRNRLDNILTSDNVRIGGIDYVADVMNHMDRSNEKFIFDEIGKRDAELAEDIRKRMFVFEDILLLDDRAIQRVLRDVENADLELALKNTTEEVQNVIYKNLSKRLAAMIKEDMDFMGPVRMKDVEEAQQKIVAVIRKLEDAGEIVISRGGGDDIVV